ncbi:N-terminal acetyltransferase A complex catalytic subunit ard1 [Cryomyces antarcticus]|nr:N-terminal acetyltransferase A complex catalytic subunit ard1 [Cryomyces antarcticus]
MDIRVLHPSDIPHVQLANITNLPENYFCKYYLYHAMSWPQSSYVAVDVSRPQKTPYDPPKIVGYVLAKMEEEPTDGVQHGHITSLSLEDFVADHLCTRVERAMAKTFGAQYVSLHVRVSNTAALRLYRDTLGFKVEKIEAKYYADGEDAYSMKMDLTHLRDGVGIDGDSSDEEDGDEGEAVGSVGKASEAEASETKKKGGKKRKVKVGRGLGVGELVERNESQKAESVGLH